MPVNADALKARALGTFRAFSPSQLVIVGLLSVLGLTGAVFFLKWVSAPTYGVLLAGLDAKDAAAVTAKLGEDGVPYRLEGGGSTVLVPQSVLDKERISVAAAGLPAGSTQDGWAAFDKQGLTSSSFQQQVAYQRALEGTLAGTLQQIDGVRQAEVHLALPEKRLFTEDQEPARASVLVQTNGPLGDEQVDAMTHLVASSVPSLAPKDVSITDGDGTLLTGNGTSSAKSEANRARYESELTAQVTTMLDTMLGPGHAVVRVNAEVDTASTTIDTTDYDPKRSVVLSERTAEEVYAPSDGATTTGGPVTSADATGQLPQATTTTTNKGNGYSKTESARQNGVSVTSTRKVLEPGGIRRLTVAVAVDANAKNAPATEDVQAMVANAVGLDPGRGDSISVTQSPFLMAEEEAAAPEKGGASAGPVALATDHGPQVVGIVLLLLVALGFVRAVKNGVTTDVPADQLTAAVEAGRRQALPGAAAALPSIPEQRSSTEDALSALDENADEVANLLRGWLENTGSTSR